MVKPTPTLDFLTYSDFFPHSLVGWTYGYENKRACLECCFGEKTPQKFQTEVKGSPCRPVDELLIGLKTTASDAL